MSVPEGEESSVLALLPYSAHTSIRAMTRPRTTRILNPETAPPFTGATLPPTRCGRGEGSVGSQGAREDANGRLVSTRELTLLSAPKPLAN